jgi:hypothetical protein
VGGKGGGGREGGEMTQALYAHMNKKKDRIKSMNISEEKKNSCYNVDSRKSIDLAHFQC